ncbi:MAG TPA: NAD-dependent epimerase [Treponema sp.]|nr:NAD-dependent epimerase [Treponema sp.]
MNYLVTGCAGFIGCYVAKELLCAGHNVTGIDSVNDYYSTDLKEERLDLLKATAKENTNSQWKFVRGNLEDTVLVDQVFSSGKFDRVIHLAAQAGVRYSIDTPSAYISSNITGFLSILEACKKHRPEHLVYASSSSVYGLNKSPSFSESDRADHPVSMYAATKRANELMAHTYSHLYNLPVTGLRFFTVYGPLGRPDMAYFKFADAIMRGEPIDVYNNGDLLRDFTYIDDVVRAILLIANSPAKPTKEFSPENPLPDRSSAPYRVYNIGNSSPEKLEYFIKLIEDYLGKKAIKNYLPMQAGDVYKTSANTGALERDFGWKPGTPLKEGLKKFIDWYKERK